VEETMIVFICHQCELVGKHTIVWAIDMPSPLSIETNLGTRGEMG
jgi:hypothetical protein